ncbi:hypothetical protein [Nostoc sp. UHCC 0870]|uniref:hypothetical protein n=1 Tax=Nostoc sp. UHCC 0870 TaxID=2914041 RepID=UPI0030D87C89|nr:hypothetical protein L6494_02735 [Nostoc sp. UHCC 0870]
MKYTEIVRVLRHIVIKNIQNFASFCSWGLGTGDWGLGTGDWGLGSIADAQFP